MRYKDVISSMKKNSREDAFSERINVLDQKGTVIGYLVPVGMWLLSRAEEIYQICSWRQRAMRMFLTQFESTVDKTVGYLRDLSIAQEGRIFFLLYDCEDRFIGHMGVSGVDGEKCELDNVVRGVSGGDPRLVFYAEVALLHWCFSELGIIESDVRVLSYNWLVISLHEQAGYTLVEKIPLKKTVANGVVIHTPVDLNDASVGYFCVRMLLKKDDFYRVNNWLNHYHCYATGNSGHGAASGN